MESFPKDDINVGVVNEAKFIHHHTQDMLI